MTSGRKGAPRVLMIDNYDSFTYNLYQYLSELGADVTVKRNDALSVADARAIAPDYLVISPGPGEITRWDGASRAAPSASSASFRRTLTSAPSSPNRCARL